MTKRISATLIASLLLCLALTITASDATVGRTLQSKLNGVADTTSVGTVIIAFNKSNGLSKSHPDVVRGVGIVNGMKLDRLGVVAAAETAWQVRELAGNGAVRSIWANDRLQYFDEKARTLGGVERLRTYAAFTKANRPARPRQRRISVVINDSGIESTPADLQLSKNVIQNIQILTDNHTLSGFTPLVIVGNLPDTDLNVGRGRVAIGQRGNPDH